MVVQCIYFTFSPFSFSRLKSELAMLRKKGAMRVATAAEANNHSSMLWAVSDPSRACGRCRAELGRIINRGAFCKVSLVCRSAIR